MRADLSSGHGSCWEAERGGGSDAISLAMNLPRATLISYSMGDQYRHASCEGPRRATVRDEPQPSNSILVEDGFILSGATRGYVGRVAKRTREIQYLAFHNNTLRFHEKRKQEHRE